MYYDDLGGTYTVGITANSNYKNGDIAPAFPINNKPTFRKPDFKTIFENMLMHDPDKHRRYFFTPDDLSIYNQNKMMGEISQKFDRKKIELQTVNNNTESNYITLSTSTIAYLKDMDYKFVKATVMSQYFIEDDEKALRKMPDYKKGSSYHKRLLNSLNYWKSFNEQTQKLFKEFVADFTRALGELNTPFVYKFQNNQGNEEIVPVGMGNFYPGEIGKMIKSVFGNVIDYDEFVPAYNEEMYNNKIQSSCCLHYEINPTIYRKQNTPYEQSKDYIKDMKEFEEFKKTPDYVPYKEPPPFKTIEVNPIVLKNYLNQASKVFNNPLGFVFEQFKPYIEEYLEDLPFLSKGRFPDGLGGYTQLDKGYEIKQNSFGMEITIHTDLRKLF